MSWDDKVPYKLDKVVVLGSSITKPILEKACNDLNIEIILIEKVPAELASLMYAATLRALEACSFVLFDYDHHSMENILYAGYALARGKTLIGIGAKVDSAINEAAYCVQTLDELAQALKALKT